MIADGLLLEEAETFDELIARCHELEAKANNLGAAELFTAADGAHT
jgi:hypothetical protein